MNRAEHLQWCKDRALQYVEAGQLQQAMASLLSDLRKHPDTTDHIGMELGLSMMAMGQLDRPGEMRQFIEGFN